MSDRVRWTIREHHWGSQAKTWKVTKASREPGFQRDPCWSSLFLPESYNKGSSADLLHLAGTSAYELYLLTEGRVYRVQANQVQYFLDKCTRVFLLFHTEPKGAWRKRWALDDIFGIQKGHVTSSGWRIPSHGVFALPPLPTWREGEQAEDWTWVLPRRARRLSGLQERGKSQHAKALTALADS